ncbi:PAS domain-containing protein [Streptomyces sp. CA-135486]|uniref:PAS domain-containing protein n=1 Tax=Streptomyces sp. CA-135486 TaxID=3240049 RepID=UPI003D92FF6F
MFWSPQAEELFGYTAEKSLGRYAGRVLLHEQDLDLVIRLFAEVMESGQSWAVPSPYGGRQPPAGGIPQHAAAGRPRRCVRPRRRR